jgi:hypothetical protein
MSYYPTIEWVMSLCSRINLEKFKHLHQSVQWLEPRYKFHQNKTNQLSYGQFTPNRFILKTISLFIWRYLLLIINICFFFAYLIKLEIDWLLENKNDNLSAMEKTRMIIFLGRRVYPTKERITAMVGGNKMGNHIHTSIWPTLSRWVKWQQMKRVTIIDISGMFIQTSSMDVRVFIVKLQ